MQPISDVGLLAAPFEQDRLRLRRVVAPPARQPPPHPGIATVGPLHGKRGYDRVHASRVCIEKRRTQRRRVVALEKRGVRAPGEKLLVPQDAHEQVAIGDDAVDTRALQRGRKQRRRLARVGACAITFASIGS